MIHRVILTILLLLLCFNSPSIAKEENQKPENENSGITPKVALDTSRIVVRIQRLTIENRPINDTLLVTVQTSSHKIAGFDLKIALASPYLKIIKILPGEIIDSCGWEYFNVKEIQPKGKAFGQISLWQAVSLAQMVSDKSEPKCYGFQKEAAILRIVVANNPLLEMKEAKIPIFFLWESCRDNVISEESGAKLFMSVNVLDYFPITLSETEGVFPTHKGALRSCVNPQSINRPIRLIEFHNGGVDFLYQVPESK